MASPQALTVFVGQIPYDATKADLEKVFADGGVRKLVSVRMLTNKETKAFRGMAYVEMENESDYERALQLDYRPLKGRRLRVERTVSGGGKTRTRGLKRLVDKDKKRRDQEVSSQITEVLEKGDGTQLAESDLDHRVREFLNTIPLAATKEALTELAGLDFRRVKNRHRYIMGVIKRKVKDAGASVEAAPNEGAPKKAASKRAETAGSTKPKGPEATRTAMFARSYDDGQWHEVKVLRDINDDKVAVRFLQSGREQEVLKEDVKERTKRKKRAAGVATGDRAGKRHKVS